MEGTCITRNAYRMFRGSLLKKSVRTVTRTSKDRPIDSDDRALSRNTVRMGGG
jgi:hypothetical protein